MLPSDNVMWPTPVLRIVPRPVIGPVKVSGEATSSLLKPILAPAATLRVAPPKPAIVPMRMPDCTSMESMSLAELFGRRRFSVPSSAVLPRGRTSLKTISGAPMMRPL